MNRIYLGLLPVLILTVFACSSNEDAADAYGNFEAVETTISAETTGRLTSFDATEGSTLDAGQIVAVVDTTQLFLQKRQLTSARDAARGRLRANRAQVDVLEEKKEVALRDQRRLQRLFEDNAATQKQLDDVDGQIRVLIRQIQQVQAQERVTRSEIESFDAQIAQVEDRIDRSTVSNPTRGTVLTAFVQRHELAAAGRPLYTMADLETLELRAYVSGAQLSAVRIGQEVEVSIDTGKDQMRSFDGRVIWIASESEFTPKLIQTKEERVNLVYAFKVLVENPDGVIKIGMPAEVRFDTALAEGGSSNTPGG